MGILDDTPPDAPYDRTMAALQQLSDDDRETILSEMKRGRYKNTTLAKKLTDHTDEIVDGNSFGNFKQRYLAGKVSL